MHPEAHAFVERIWHSDLVNKDSVKRIAEFGSRNFCGGIRDVFLHDPDADVEWYRGIDLSTGIDVDYVANAEDWSPDDNEPVDLVVSCEALEHAPNPKII